MGDINQNQSLDGLTRDEMLAVKTRTKILTLRVQVADADAERDEKVNRWNKRIAKLEKELQALEANNS